MERNEILSKINKKKYEITYWNKNLIKMDLFKSFLIIDIELIEDHLGASNGWTMYENTKHELTITGGFFEGVEYLHTLRYKENLDNPWNNFVNPFHLFDIFKEDGKRFFCEYYKEDINGLLEKCNKNIEISKSELTKLESDKKDIENLFFTIDN